MESVSKSGPCELRDCCQFFKDNMGEFPQAAEYIKSKLCHADKERCTRYQIYNETGGDGARSLYTLRDEEEVAKINQCLRKRRSPVPEGEPGGESP